MSPAKAKARLRQTRQAQAPAHHPEKLPVGWAQAGTPVYRVAPKHSASTTTLPTVGDVATEDVYAEVQRTGDTNWFFFLWAKAGVPFFPPA